MFKFDKKPEQHIPHLEKNKSQQQMRGGSQYDAMRQMSSLVGNQAMLAMMQSIGQSQTNETPFTGQMRERFGLPRRPAEQSKAPDRTSAGGVSLPDYLREKFEKKSGLPMDDVRVHYNSDKPEQLGALAYTYGTDVYVGPGQEEHLEHELGHVVQQKQGIVKPTHRIEGLFMNSSSKLEDSATTSTLQKGKQAETWEPVVQRCPSEDEEDDENYLYHGTEATSHSLKKYGLKSWKSFYQATGISPGGNTQKAQAQQGRKPQDSHDYNTTIHFGDFETANSYGNTIVRVQKDKLVAEALQYIDGEWRYNGDVSSELLEIYDPQDDEEKKGSTSDDELFGPQNDECIDPQDPTEMKHWKKLNQYVDQQ